MLAAKQARLPCVEKSLHRHINRVHENALGQLRTYSYSHSLLHPIARASVKDERRNRHDKTGTISEILCTCKLNHWQDRRYSLTEASDLRLSRGTEFKTEKQK